MRLEQATPLTRLLAAAAGLSLLALFGAFAGLGAEAALLPDDRALLQPVAGAVATAEPRLQPLSRYAVMVQRPLFSDDRRPRPFVLDGMADPARTGAFDYILTSVLVSPQLEMAIVTPTGGGVPERVRLGSPVEGAPGWRLVEIEPRRAVFEGPQGREILELRHYQGVAARPTNGSATVQPARQPAANAMDAMDAAAAGEAGMAMDADGGGGERASAVQNP